MLIETKQTQPPTLDTQKFRVIQDMRNWVFCGVVADEQRDRLHKKTEKAYALSPQETRGVGWWRFQ